METLGILLCVVGVVALTVAVYYFRAARRLLIEARAAVEPLMDELRRR